MKKKGFIRETYINHLNEYGYDCVAVLIMTQTDIYIYIYITYLNKDMMAVLMIVTETRMTWVD